MSLSLSMTHKKGTPWTINLLQSKKKKSDVYVNQIGLTGASGGWVFALGTQLGSGQLSPTRAYPWVSDRYLAVFCVYGPNSTTETFLEFL